MHATLVDSNVILDVFTEDKVWFNWSSTQLEHYAEQGLLIINPIIYAEISARFQRIEVLEEALPAAYFTKRPLPFEAAFLAEKVFQRYKKNGGGKSSTLSDFFIGAHAAVENLQLLTRDKKRYGTYFPTVPLIAPI